MIDSYHSDASFIAHTTTENIVDVGSRIENAPIDLLKFLSYVGHAMPCVGNLLRLVGFNYRTVMGVTFGLLSTECRSCNRAAELGYLFVFN